MSIFHLVAANTYLLRRLNGFKNTEFEYFLTWEVFSVSVVGWLQGLWQLAPPFCWRWCSQRQPSGDHRTGPLEQVDQPTPLSVDCVWSHQFRGHRWTGWWSNTYSLGDLGNHEARGNRLLEDLRRRDFRLAQGGEVRSEVINRTENNTNVGLFENTIMSIKSEVRRN